LVEAKALNDSVYASAVSLLKALKSA